jgi:hypothetical protein
MSKPLKLSEVAAQIFAHLKRLEADKEWNAPTAERGGRHRVWCVNCYQAGGRVRVTYVSYQGPVSLTKDAAVRYLAALDGGLKGRHWEVPAEQS